MNLTARSDYAMRALCELAAAPPGALLKADAMAAAQRIPRKFLTGILLDLRHAGIVASQRGADGGYRLARPPASVAVADVLRVIDGPLAIVHGVRPESTRYEGPAAHLQEVWIAVRAAVRTVLEGVTLADVVAGDLPEAVAALTADPDAWAPH